MRYYVAMCYSELRLRDGRGEDHALAPAAELLPRSDHEYEPELKHACRR